MLIYKNSKFVKELSPKNFTTNDLNKQLIPLRGQPILVKYYAHWCPHCHNPEMKEFMEALGNVLPKKTGIKVAAFSCQHNKNHEDIAQNLDIMGFPTFKYYNKNGKVSEYNGPRDVKSLLEFMLKNS